MSTAITILGTSILALLLAGYFGQKFMPPPKPKIVGIDLGTTYSCIGVYHAVTGQVRVIPDKEDHLCIPSVVAFREKAVVVGHRAVAQAEHNPSNTFYDGKRFIGKAFSTEELAKEAGRYQFKLVPDEYGMIRYAIQQRDNVTMVTPEYIGSQILTTLKQSAETNLSSPVTRAVMSVPAEFDEMQRNYTRMAARLAGIDVLRIINEPTAAALAYGLHKKEGTNNVLVVDLGGGTLDVSLLNIQGGMFSTQAMAGNNHLGGQDFNQRLFNHLLRQIKQKFGRELKDPEDLQLLRQQTEDIKLNLTNQDAVFIHIPLHSFRKSGHMAFYKDKIMRATFEELNEDLFKRVLDPVKAVLHTVEMEPSEIDEIVLVGGSTRIPKVRKMIREYFDKDPNTSIDPELAVTYGVSIQAGIIGGMWPLTVSAIELPSRVKKIHIR
ncbi:heat shock 70 kDa protein 13 [Lingula anatina]|uniref:Heat shock 70 kDa protein 13 n=1 Tax=Lingula anatina TaxID=7574 RepID=A0A1S3JJR1_LINAN|nr:heat shock 70 kDa protein 13 [Lingula anatina]|eukprot:XP_013410612.1 heat shock 70 kDa protein 13 [Lingula anatina]